MNFFFCLALFSAVFLAPHSGYALIVSGVPGARQD